MDDWDEFLATAELAINAAVSNSTGYMLFYANYWFEPRLQWHTHQPQPDNKSAYMMVEHLQAVHVFCRDAAVKIANPKYCKAG